MLQLTAFDPAQKKLVHRGFKAVQAGLHRRHIPAINRAIYTVAIMQDVVRSIRSEPVRARLLKCLDNLADYNA
jgi:hypothetical protein